VRSEASLRKKLHFLFFYIKIDLITTPAIAFNDLVLYGYCELAKIKNRSLKTE